MATMDPIISPGNAGGATVAPKVGTAGTVDHEALSGDVSDAEARADVEVSDLDNFVSPTGGGDSHIGSISDRSGDMSSTTGI